jgi:hypothetical protein
METENMFQLFSVKNSLEINTTINFCLLSFLVIRPKLNKLWQKKIKYLFCQLAEITNFFRLHIKSILLMLRRLLFYKLLISVHSHQI